MSSSVLVIADREHGTEGSDQRDKKRKRERKRKDGANAVVYDFGSEPRTFQRSFSDLTRYAGSGLKISSDTPST